MWELASLLKTVFQGCYEDVSSKEQNPSLFPRGGEFAGARRALPPSPRGRQGAVWSRPASLVEPRGFPQTVQILIGLIHLGFGSVLLMVRRGHVGMLFIEGGVPFWGGACVSAGAIWGSPLPSAPAPLHSFGHSHPSEAGA